MWTRYKVNSRSGPVDWEYAWIHPGDASLYKESEDCYIDDVIEGYTYRGDPAYDRGVEVEIDVIPPIKIVEATIERYELHIRSLKSMMYAQQQFIIDNYK